MGSDQMLEGKLDEAMEQGSEAQQSLPDQEATNTTPPAIRAFDQNGREVMVPREEWLANVIPNMLKDAWNNPDQLYAVILNSLNDGFIAEMSEAAARLHEIDTIAGRGVCMLAIVQMGTGRRDEAEALLTGFLDQHGDDASVLVNLAKIQAEKGDIEVSRQTLWHAIEVEPNHDGGLGWYASMVQERGGEEAAREVIERIAEMPRSWRAQLWLARGELNRGNGSKARGLYEQALERAPRPVPPDLLMQMSGDLGSKGLLRDLVELTAPHFVPEYHGLAVGNNLIKALVDTGNLNPAEQVKAALWQQNRPDWKDALSFWDAEIARRRVAAVDATHPEAASKELQVGMLRIDGPIWLPPGSPARSVFAAKSPVAPKVTFLGGTAEAPETPGDVQAQVPDALGRLTRSLPLFFSEQVEMRTAAAGRAMVPWAVAPMTGFVVSGQRWPDQIAVQSVQSAAENATDYVVSVHLDAEIEPWTAELVFIRTSDGTRIGELEAEFDPARPEEGLADLADEVVELLKVLGPATQSSAYEVPGPATFASYLLRLEQLLAVRCATMEGVPAQFLNGESEMLQSNLQLCLAEPANIPARMLLLSVYAAFQRVKPEVAAPFAEEIERLKQNHPLPLVDDLPV